MTNGYLQAPGDPRVTWPGAVPLGVPFQVRQPLMNWGFGAQLIDGDGGAVGSIFAGLFFDGVSVLVLFLGYRLGRNWWGHRQEAGGGRRANGLGSVAQVRGRAGVVGDAVEDGGASGARG